MQEEELISYYLTYGRRYQVLRIDVGDWDGNTRFAKYDHFRVGKEAKKSSLFDIGSYYGRSRRGGGGGGEEVGGGEKEKNRSRIKTRRRRRAKKRRRGGGGGRKRSGKGGRRGEEEGQ